MTYFWNFNNNERKGIIILLLLLFCSIIVYQYIPFFSISLTGTDNQNDIHEKMLAYNALIQCHDNLHNSSIKTDHLADDSSNNSTKKIFSKNLSKQKANTNNIDKGKINTPIYINNLKIICKFASENADPFDSTNNISETKTNSVIPEFTGGLTTIQEHRQIELNSATDQELMKVKGIGEKLSLRIIKYRYLLGGFHDINQLKEVYGLDTLLVNEQHFYVNKEAITKININKSSWKTLRKHPYLSEKSADEIIILRQQQGGIKYIEELLMLSSIDKNTFYKLAPYITLE